MNLVFQEYFMHQKPSYLKSHNILIVAWARKPISLHSEMQPYGKHISRKERHEYQANERNLGMWEVSFDHPPNVLCVA